MATIRGDAAEIAIFERAAALVLELGIQSDADLGPLLSDPQRSLDPSIEKRLRQMYDAGAWVIVESAIADLPADLRWLFESGAVSIEQLAALHLTLGATTVADLVAAVEQQELAAIAGFDRAAIDAIERALAGLRAAVPRIALGSALAIADPILACLQARADIDWVLTAGSLRRGQDTVGDIEIIAAAVDPADAIEAVMHLPTVVRPLQRNARQLFLLLERAQVGIRFPDPGNAGALLLHKTGSVAHFNQLRERAGARGWRLDSHGLHAADGILHLSVSEEDIYARLDLPFIPPEIRHGEDEVAVAALGRLPTLVARSDIRGDLHMHSTWSDGRDSIEAMVVACQDLGYEFLAITDHSPHSAATRNLTTEGVSQQAEEIMALRERYPGIAILHGCEVDILPNGRLDFPDRVLERFDIVLASLHDRSGHSADELMQRYTNAMRHPLVALITHPTNRLVPHRRGYDLDYDRLFALAAETGTAVEIDGAPSHLDLDGALARRAIGAGALVVISSDCHRADMLGRQMELGTLMARRGWVEPAHVLNTRPLADIRAFIERKRSRAAPSP